jgi:N-acetylmuramoyl-L-alanine amidase
MKVFIDPGHGGSEKANRGPTGYVEADGVLDIALKLKPLLQRHFDVKLSRETDITVPLYARSDMANAWGADILVSIHTNAASNPEAQGIEIFHSKIGEWGGRFATEASHLAAYVLKFLVKETGRESRGIKTSLVRTPGSPIQGMDYYAVLRRTRCPAIIVEAGFHTNPEEEALLKTPEFRQKVAEAIAKGILCYAGLYNDEKEEGPFKDVPPNHWAIEAIKYVKENKFMMGFPDGTFRPETPLTRAQMASIFYTVLSKLLQKS